MSKIKISFSGLSVPEQIERARHIITLMTGNANYTSPIPALSVVNTANDVLESAYNASRGRDKNLVTAMRLRRKEMLFQIGQLSAYVQEASIGDAEKILSSGFDVRGSKTPHPVIAGAVLNVRLSDGSSTGRIAVVWDKADNAIMYVVVVSTTPDFNGADEPKGITTKTHKEMSGFITGTRYWVKVIGLGREEFGPASEPISIMVR